jgi:mercuric ion binding protein
MKIMRTLASTLLIVAFLAPSAFAASFESAELSVQNMTCSLCPITVRKALEQVPGVKSVTVDLETKTAKVTYDQEQAKVEDLIKATTNAGYPSSLIKENAKNR